MSFQIFICVAEKKHPLIVRKDNSVKELIGIITEKFVSGMNANQIELGFANKTFDMNSIGTLEDMKICQGSLLQLIGIVRGGMPTESEIKEKETKLKPLPGYIQVTTLKNQPDVITYEDGEYPKRAVMPCGHAISPRSMTEYCEAIIQENKNNLTCPSCRELWDWSLVRHVACFNNEEWKTIEEKIIHITLKARPHYRQCPGCQMWLKKGDGNEIEIFNCWNCTQKNGSPYLFCWYCLYVTDLKTNECPMECIKKNVEFVLKNCSMKSVGGQDCYSIRKCPKCRLLIEHKEGCKHMKCNSCKCEFCFVCMHTSVLEGWYGHIGQLCILAPQ